LSQHLFSSAIAFLGLVLGGAWLMLFSYGEYAVQKKVRTARQILGPRREWKDTGDAFGDALKTQKRKPS
jgi:hypothetical protein